MLIIVKKKIYIVMDDFENIPVAKRSILKKENVKSFFDI